MITVSKFVRQHIQTLAPYSPIVPFDVLSEQLGRPIDEIIKLDANENPYGPSPKAIEAVNSLPFPHIYPDPESRKLRALLSGFLNVPAEQILCGAGADELIDLILRLVLDPGDAILNCPPTFGMYAFDTAINAGKVISVPRNADFSLDLDRIQAEVVKNRPKIMFITSPNNPDGGVISDKDLKRLLSMPILIVLDEAYVDYAGADASRMHWATEHDNLIVMGTFSKWAGLAGLRVGYGAFPKDLMPYLWKLKQPYNINVAGDAAAIASLQDIDYLQANLQLLIEERERLSAKLSEISYLDPLPTQSAFVLCNVTGDKQAGDLKQTLADHGILVRYFNKPGVSNMIRISVGKPEHTDKLIAVLKELE